MKNISKVKSFLEMYPNIDKMKLSVTAWSGRSQQLAKFEKIQMVWSSGLTYQFKLRNVQAALKTQLRFTN